MQIEVQDILTYFDGAAAVNTALLLLLGTLMPEQNADDELKAFLDKNPQIAEYVKSNIRIKNNLIRIFDDQFKKEVFAKERNLEYLNLLKNLKVKVANFYIDKITNNTINTGNTKLFCQAQDEFELLFIQLLKFRLVVSPKVQIAKNTHNETKIKYYFAKGFWINEEGKEYRKFIKSVGRVDAFKGGKNDHELNEEAAKKIQEAAYEAYKKEYNN
jgi:hypothetical protein